MDNLPRRLRHDLLSELPLSIILIILSLVPTREAVRTSILSRKWRYIWSSLPRLDFDNKDVEIDSLLCFISQALLLHKGPINEFQLRLVDKTHKKLSIVQCQYIDQWLLFLSRNDIRILVIDIYRYYYDFRPSLYDFQYLTHLKLHAHSIPPLPPSFKGFLFLRSLDILTMEEEDSSTIESIVAHSPLLEELTLGGFHYMEITICDLNLKYLHISSPPGNLSLCTPLLQEFKGCVEGVQSFSIGVEPLVFHHLRTIELSTVQEHVIPGVLHLITGSPNLQKLEIIDWLPPYDEPEPKPDCFWGDESLHDITYDSLKVIKMVNCDGKINEMKLIEFLLARSPVLETLMYKPSRNTSDKILVELTTQLLRCRRASPNARIVIG